MMTQIHKKLQQKSIKNYLNLDDKQVQSLKEFGNIDQFQFNSSPMKQLGYQNPQAQSVMNYPGAGENTDNKLSF